MGYSHNFKNFVYEYYKEVCNVQDFAALANMNVRSFQRKFKEEFKVSAHDWLKERRAERILHDLRNTNKSFAEIAEDYGFSASSYFITFCKRYFGQTPKQLRLHSEALYSDAQGEPASPSEAGEALETGVSAESFRADAPLRESDSIKL